MSALYNVHLFMRPPLYERSMQTISNTSVHVGLADCGVKILYFLMWQTHDAVNNTDRTHMSAVWPVANSAGTGRQERPHWPPHLHNAAPININQLIRYGGAQDGS